MVTKIELGSFTIGASPNGGQKYVINPARELVAELPDVPGRYTTKYGQVGMDFIINPSGKKSVALNIAEIPMMQAKGHKTEVKKQRRLVEVDRDGKGMTFLPKGKVLFVSTGAPEEQFKK